MAALVELHRSKVEDQGNGVLTFWQRFHGAKADATWLDGEITATFTVNGSTTAIDVGTEMPTATGYFCQSVDIDIRPENMPGRVLATVVWRKFEDYA